MDLVWEWQKSNGQKPESRLQYREYVELLHVVYPAAMVLTDDREDQWDELLNRWAP